MQQKHFDIVVLGGGPGGYPAAIRAAQSGRSVALIEAKELGGTCLNRGCIPTKTLIANAHLLHQIKRAKDFGILVDSFSVNFKQMFDRKEKTVNDIRKSLTGLIASNRITVIKGYGKFTGPKEIKVIGEDNCILTGDAIIIATGSEPRNIAQFPFDHQHILSSTSILELTTLPKSLVIIGGGVIGCEFASFFNQMGVAITILEMMPSILPTEDKSVSTYLTETFTKQGIKVKTNMTVQGIDKTTKGIKVKLGNGETVEADMALVAVGRSLNTSDIGLDKAGITVEPSGIIPVNSRMETCVDGVYAVGDIASKWWLAHVATHQGVIAAENAIGEGPAQMHYNAIPNVIFTQPEIGTVGLNLEQAKEKGYQAVTGAFPFQALGKSQAALETEGFAQIVIDTKTGQILGAQVVGYEAATLIAEMTAAIANELTVECITETIHAHPTISEAWHEAALLVSGHPIHLPPKRGRAS
jgi:dihydrolipoamide dehydrogenase